MTKAQVFPDFDSAIPLPDTIYELFENATTHFGAKNFLGTRQPNAPEYTWETYGRIKTRVHSVRMGLVSLIDSELLQRGRCLGLHKSNCVDFVLADQAFNAFSMTLVPLYQQTNKQNFEEIAKETEFQIGVVDENLAPLWLSAVKTLKVLITSLKLSDEMQKLAQAKGVKLLTLREIEEVGAKIPVDPSKWNPPKPEDIYTMIYTSGTTGIPKGAMYSNKTMLKVVSAEFIPPAFRVKPNDLDYCYMPFAHSYTRYIFLRYLRRGILVAFPSGNPTLTLFSDIAIAKPTTFATVPSILNAVLQKALSKLISLPEEKRKVFYEDVERLNKLPLEDIYFKPLPNVSPIFTAISESVKNTFGSRLRMLVCGSAMLSEEIRNLSLLLLQCPIIEGYGQTEHISVASTSPFLIRYQKDTVGSILPTVQYKFVDNNGAPELCVKSGFMFDGYYKRESILDSDGFLHTRDSAEIIEVPTQSENDEQPKTLKCLRLFGRVDFIVKLANGEFLVLEQLEHVAKEVLCVKNAYFYCESGWNSTVALIELMDDQVGKVDLNELREQIILQLKKAKRPTYEFPRAIGFINGNEIDVSLFTPTKKLIRKKFIEVFKPRFDELYYGNAVSTEKNQPESKPVEVKSEVVVDQKKFLSVLTKCCQDAMEYKAKIEENQNLFSVGANSRTIVQLQALIELNFGVEIDLPDLFTNPTIRQICDLIVKKIDKTHPMMKSCDSNSSATIAPNFPSEFGALERGSSEKGMKTFADRFTHKPFNKIEKGIFLSGATGFLGSFVLKCLCEQSQNKIHVLIRSKEKFESTMKAYFSDFEITKYPIVCHVGDIEKDLLGFTKEEYDEIASSIDCVVHIAALVKHAVIDTKLSHNAINVIGSLNCCKLALAANASFHHTSTTGVGGTVSHNRFPLEFTEECPPQIELEGSFSGNVYVKSKRDAELALIKDEALKTVNKRFYRIGNLTWTPKGVFQTNTAENGFVQRMKGFHSLNAFSASAAFNPVELTSVDQCALAYSTLVLNQHEIPQEQRVFHLFNHHTVPLHCFLDVIAPSACCVADDEFAALMKANMNKSGVAVLRFYQKTAMQRNPQKNSIVLIRNRITANTLAKFGFQWNYPSDEELKAFIDITREL